MKNKRIAIYGIVIAIYTSISLALSSISFGMIQIRIAEALLVLCLYDKKYILPITLGCFVTNLIGIINGLNIMITDLFAGTLATFISAICVYYFRDTKIGDFPIISLILPAIINGIMIGIELNYYFPGYLIEMIVYVMIGELLSVTLLGGLLYKPIGKALTSIVEWYNWIMNIDIKKLGDIKLELDELKENQALFIDEDGKTKYAIIPIDYYDKSEEVMTMMNQMDNIGSNVRIIGPDSELTYEEYERIKTGIMEAVEKTLKPKAEKLN